MADMRGISGRALARQGNPLGAPTFTLYYNSSTSSGTSNTDTVVAKAPFKFKILRAYFHLTEAPLTDSEDVKLTNGTNDITDTADYSAGAIYDAYEFSHYDTRYNTISKDGSLKIVKTAGAAVTSFEMFIECIRL